MAFALALETSTAIGSVALFEDTKVLGLKRLRDQRSHSEWLHRSIVETLKENNLSLRQLNELRVGVGPGSFTGIRVSLNSAKSLAYALKLPLAAYSSLETMAHNVSQSEYPILCMINAYKNMVYAQIFKREGSCLVATQEPGAVSVRDLLGWLPTAHSQFLVLGDGYLHYHKFFSPELSVRFLRPCLVSTEIDFPLAEKMDFSTQTMDWKTVQPLYIRASEAEENKSGVFFKPLA